MTKLPNYRKYTAHDMPFSLTRAICAHRGIIVIDPMTDNRDPRTQHAIDGVSREYSGGVIGFAADDDRRRYAFVSSYGQEIGEIIAQDGDRYTVRMADGYETGPREDVYPIVRTGIGDHCTMIPCTCELEGHIGADECANPHHRAAHRAKLDDSNDQPFDTRKDHRPTRADYSAPLFTIMKADDWTVTHECAPIGDTVEHIARWFAIGNGVNLPEYLPIFVERMTNALAGDVLSVERVNDDRPALVLLREGRHTNHRPDEHDDERENLHVFESRQLYASEERYHVWMKTARDLGREAGERAGEWAADGNTALHVIRHTLDRMDEGDPDVYNDLPRQPDLSGEFTTGPTPFSLAEDVMGGDMARNGYFGDRISDLCSAWEEGVSETFEASCERTLRSFLPDCPGHSDDEDCETDPQNPCDACIAHGNGDDIETILNEVAKHNASDPDYNEGWHAAISAIRVRLANRT